MKKSNNKKNKLNKKIIIPVVTLALVGTSFYAVKNTPIKENIQNFTGIYESKNTNAEARVPYTFPDPNLQATVLKQLKGKGGSPIMIKLKDPNFKKDESDNTIYIDELENIVRIDLNAKNISDITGIEKMVNLTELYIFANRIENIEPLRTLTNLEILK